MKIRNVEVKREYATLEEALAEANRLNIQLKRTDRISGDGRVYEVTYEHNGMAISPGWWTIADESAAEAALLASGGWAGQILESLAGKG